MYSRRLWPLLLLPTITATLPSRAVAQGQVIQRSELHEFFPDSFQAGKLRVAAGAHTETIANSTNALRLHPGQVITAAAGNAATTATRFARPPRPGLIALPFRYLTTNTAGTATLYLRPTVEIAGGGLHYEGAKSGLRGSFLLGLEDSLHPDRSDALAAGIQFAITADADTLRPSTIAIGHTNLPFAEVVVVAIAPTDSVRVHIRPQFNPQGVDLWLRVQRPALTLRPSPARIQGFGLETTTLTVGRAGSAPSERRTVVLTANPGNPEPNEVTLGENGTALAKLRSSGTGTAVIHAESAPFEPADAEVEFVFPLAFLIAALLGGGLGGLAQTLQGRRSGKRPSLMASAFTGGAVGLVAAVLCAIGINVFHLDVGATYGEALVFGMAALGALAGVPGLARLLGLTAKAGD